MNQELH
jgi:hypothetical protein